MPAPFPNWMAQEARNTESDKAFNQTQETNYLKNLDKKVQSKIANPKICNDDNSLDKY